MPPHPVKVAIVGLGLIGGSLARDLAALGHEVIAHDADRSALRAARRAGIVAGSAGPALEHLRGCRVCVLAVPVDAAIALVLRARHALAPVPVVTDVGSTKQSIVQAASHAGLGGQFVGAHPFAGDHHWGWKASRGGLFESARVFLTPTARTRPGALQTVRALWRGIGARPVTISARRHDALMAAASHVPQVTSAALGRVLAHAGIRRSMLGAGGRDVTRLAGGHPGLWSAILRDNAEVVVPLIHHLAAELREIAGEIERGNAPGVNGWLARANGWFNAHASGPTA